MSTQSNIRRALVMDAVSQVLDNRVFRILFVLSSVFVAATFLVGFREDELSIGLGLLTYPYDEILADTPFETLVGGASQQEQLIVLVQGVLAEVVAGTFGILFCIAATSFFLPQLLQKGFADSFFSKPVSRWQLIASRYFASVLLIAFLAIFLVGGAYLGILTASGFSDAGFLWSALTLIYTFSLISSFTILFGALTRNTVATLLLTFLAYFINGGIHTAWTGMGNFREDNFVAEIEQKRDEGLANDGAVIFFRVISAVLNPLHYTLPKTNDSDYITAKLRDRVVFDEEDFGGGTVTLTTDEGETIEQEGDSFQWLDYEQRLSWTGPLPTNLSFSIASSLAFVLAALGLAWRRVRKISF
ncbi:MAG: hypothetical protein AAFZ65_02365 [Planctomycetota bacterium]